MPTQSQADVAQHDYATTAPSKTEHGPFSPAIWDYHLSRSSGFSIAPGCTRNVHERLCCCYRQCAPVQTPGQLPGLVQAECLGFSGRQGWFLIRDSLPMLLSAPALGWSGIDFSGTGSPAAIHRQSAHR